MAYFCGTHMYLLFSFFLEISTLKTFNLHAVYVKFDLRGTIKLLHYAIMCNIYRIYICIIYIYIYIKVLRFLCKPSFTMYCPSLEYEGIIFSKKSYLKSFSWGRLLEKIYWERYMEGLMIRS